jgi:transposase
VDQYVALDVSLQKTAVCVLNVSGRVLIEADVPSEPAALIAFIQTHAPRAARVGLESGPTSPWLWHSLRAAGLPVVCMDARHVPSGKRAVHTLQRFTPDTHYGAT